MLVIHMCSYSSLLNNVSKMIGGYSGHKTIVSTKYKRRTNLSSTSIFVFVLLKELEFTYHLINYLPLPVFLTWVVLTGLGCGVGVFLSPFLGGFGFGEPKNFDVLFILFNYIWYTSYSFIPISFLLSLITSWRPSSNSSILSKP